MVVRLAVVGDIHSAFGARDAHYFNKSEYDALLLTGDLPGWNPLRYRPMIDALQTLTKPTFMIPGNHDGTTWRQLAREAFRTSGPLKGGARGIADKMASMRADLPNIVIGGYSVHSLKNGSSDDLGIDLVMGRPHSMGGAHLAFEAYLQAEFGVASMADSAAAIVRSALGSSLSPILFLAHNGPTGLGAQRDALWGCDFRRGAGDFGDADLRGAIDSLVTSGRRVLGVIAGHMHHELRGGGIRKWCAQHEGIIYVNAARVPRIQEIGRGRLRAHYVRLEIEGELCRATECFY